MKRYGWLFEKAFSKENISLAITKASKRKRRRKIVQKILANKEFYVDEIYNLVWSGKFEPHPYIKKDILDGISGKSRTLSKPQFYPDHIIHWCIYIVLYPILEKSLIHNTCASLKNRGQVYGKNICKKKLIDKKHSKYYLKLDIRKYYPSINNEKLLILLSRKIKDVKMMALIKKILDMDDGLPIGMILSQLFANYYIYQIDHKHDNHDYIRYADDIVIFSSSKRDLHKVKKVLDEDFRKLNLSIKPNYQIYKTDKEMLDYMGYRLDHNKIIMRKKIMYRFNRKIITYNKNPSYRNACGIIAYMGWVKNSNSWGFYNQRVKPNVNFTKVRRTIKKGK